MAGLADAKDDCVTKPSGTLFSSQHAEIAASLKKMLICGCKNGSDRVDVNLNGIPDALGFTYISCAAQMLCRMDELVRHCRTFLKRDLM